MSHKEPYVEKAGPLEMSLVWGGCIVAAPLFWYGVYRLVVWAIMLPTVYESHDTGHCVRVDDPQGVYSCENMPTKYHNSWVQ